MSETQRMDQVYFVTSTAELVSPDAPNGKTEARGWLSGFDLPRSTAQWTATTYAGLAVLFAIWCFQLYSTWATWGNVTIDSGHEMYIPVVLAQGKMLYRDVWFMYTPLAPYFNSYLFRIFGIHLNVLYLAGALAALGSAIFLFFAGISLSSWMAGWAAGAVILLEAFRPSLFSFPAPIQLFSGLRLSGGVPIHLAHDKGIRLIELVVDVGRWNGCSGGIVAETRIRHGKLRCARYSCSNARTGWKVMEVGCN